MRNSVVKYLSLSSKDRHFKIKAKKYGHKQFKIKYPNSSKPTRSLTIELNDLNLILATPTIINDFQYLHFVSTLYSPSILNSAMKSQPDQ